MNWFWIRSLVFFCTAVGLVAVPQYPQDVWSLLAGGAEDDRANGAALLDDGTVLIVGCSGSHGQGGLDGWALAVDGAGAKLWEKTYGSTEDEVFYDAAPVAGGGAILAGYSESVGGPGGDFWIVKIALSGDVIWQKSIGGGDLDWAYSVDAVESGGYVIAGLTYSFGSGSKDAWVIKLDDWGSVEWQHAIGGVRDEWVYGVASIPGGGYGLAGMTDGFGAGAYNGWFLKLNGAGATAWQKTLGTYKWEYLYDLITTSDGGLLFAGAAGGSGGLGYDLWLIKTDADGDILWQHRYGLETKTESGVGLHEMAQGGYGVLGLANGTALGDYDGWLLQVNEGGDPAWQKVYGGTGDDRLGAILPLPGADRVMVGRTESYGAGDYDALVMRVNENGAMSSVCLPNQSVFFEDSQTTYTEEDSTAGNVATAATLTPTSFAVEDVAEEPTICVSPCSISCEAQASPSSGMQPLEVLFSSTVQQTDCVGEWSYDWDWGDGTAHGTTANPSHVYEDFGTFTWTFRAEIEGYTCTGTGIIEVSERVCSLSCGGTADPESGPVPLSVAFSADVVATDCLDDPAFEWDFGDGTPTSSRRDLTHVYYDLGTYDWTLTVTADDAVCVDTGTVEVTDPPCRLTCSAVVTPPQDAALPAVTSFSGSAVAVDCIGAPGYHWDFGDGQASSQQFVQHTYTDPGGMDWTLTVTVDDQICMEGGTLNFVRIPGDANVDGTVSIGEVQLAVNMFLGSEPPGAGADCDENGSLSIGEVQRVINNFLGSRSLCP